MSLKKPNLQDWQQVLLLDVVCAPCLLPQILWDLISNVSMHTVHYKWFSIRTWVDQKLRSRLEQAAEQDYTNSPCPPKPTNQGWCRSLGWDGHRTRAQAGPMGWRSSQSRKLAGQKASKKKSCIKAWSSSWNKDQEKSLSLPGEMRARLKYSSGIISIQLLSGRHEATHAGAETEAAGHSWACKCEPVTFKTVRLPGHSTTALGVKSPELSN